MKICTDESKRIDVPAVASEDDIAGAEDDDESGEELDVLSVDGPVGNQQMQVIGRIGSVSRP